jgi:hypothetical protein
MKEQLTGQFKVKQPGLLGSLINPQFTLVDERVGEFLYDSSNLSMYRCVKHRRTSSDEWITVCHVRKNVSIFGDTTYSILDGEGQEIA